MQRMQTAWSLYAIATLVLVLRALSLSVAQAWLRVRYRAFVIPEDATFFRVDRRAEEMPLVTRLAAVWRNDLECIPLFLAAGAGYAAAEGPAAWAALYFGSFVLARFAHGAAYLAGKQPLRFYAWAVGQTVLVAIAIHTARIV